jgi:hypothetical protein
MLPKYTCKNKVFAYRLTEKRNENLKSLLAEINIYENNKSKSMREKILNPWSENTN